MRSGACRSLDSRHLQDSVRGYTLLGWGGTAWVAIGSIATAGMLVVAVVAQIYAKREWASTREQLGLLHLSR